MLAILSRNTLLLVGLLSICRGTAACSLTIGLSSDFPPYHVVDQNKNWQGATVDLAAMLVKQAGCELVIVELPWARSLRLLESGDIQLISHFTYTPERARYSQFLGPHHIEKIAFLANQLVSNEVNTAELLPQFSGNIGITRGDYFGERFEQLVMNNALVNTKLVDIRNNRDRVSMLVMGRLDGIFYDEMSAQYLLASNARLKSKLAIRFTFEGSPVYWGVNKEHVSDGIKQALNEAWLSMLAQNRIEPVYQKYGLQINFKEINDFPLQLLKR